MHGLGLNAAVMGLGLRIAGSESEGLGGSVTPNSADLFGVPEPPETLSAEFAPCKPNESAGFGISRPGGPASPTLRAGRSAGPSRAPAPPVGGGSGPGPRVKQDHQW